MDLASRSCLFGGCGWLSTLTGAVGFGVRALLRSLGLSGQGSSDAEATTSGGEEESTYG
jgi:hypothetical protein